MNNPQYIAGVYDKASKAYSEKFFQELDHKPFDQMILKAFAENVQDKKTIDLGCGPGQTTRFLFDHGVKNILGTDISPAMIEQAKILNPEIKFEMANMLDLKYAESSFSAALAFYAIVHFTDAELNQVFTGVNKILASGSVFLFSFHIGTENVRVENFLDQGLSLDFRFFQTEDVIRILNGCGFKEESVVERFPYMDSEYPSKRAYIWCYKS